MFKFINDNKNSLFTSLFSISLALIILIGLCKVFDEFGALVVFFLASQDAKRMLKPTISQVLTNFDIHDVYEEEESQQPEINEKKG